MCDTFLTLRDASAAHRRAWPLVLCVRARIPVCARSQLSGPCGGTFPAEGVSTVELAEERGSFLHVCRGHFSS